MKKIGFGVLLIALNSCGPISINRSYLFEMEDKGPEYMVAGTHFDKVAGDVEKPAYTKEQMYERTPDKEKVFPLMSEQEKLKAESVNKIDALTEEQKAWFAQNEGFFTSESQKIYFLNLSEQEQSEYLANNMQNTKLRQNYRHPASITSFSARSAREVALGMSKTSVIEVWGNPHRVDVAGNPRLENERWTFYEAGSKKYIYFASGQVEGWVTE